MKKQNSVKLKKSQAALPEEKPAKKQKIKLPTQEAQEEAGKSEDSEDSEQDNEDSLCEQPEEDAKQEYDDEEASDYEEPDDDEADEQNESDEQDEVEEKEQDKQSDYFWMKALITMIVVIWIALFAGSWAGNYMLDSKLFSKKQAADDPNKPKVWKTIISDDNTKTAVPADNTDELKIDDYKNSDEPIPGIDDQALKTLQAKDIMLQEPVPETKTSETEPVQQEQPKASETQPTQQEEQREQASVPQIAHPPIEGQEQQPAYQEQQPTYQEPANTGASHDSGAHEKTNQPQQPAAINGTSLLPPAGSYNIQIGSFEKEENAGRIADELKSKGHETVVERVRQGGEDVFKVKIIEKDSHASAEKKAADLKNEGYDAYVVPR